MIADFGTRPDGQVVEAVDIGGHGLSARFLTHGATLQDLRLEGVGHPLVLGFPDLGGYLAHPDMYCGAIVGRVANRIGEGRAIIAGRRVRLDRNFLGRHLLHGGADGTARRNWRLVEHSDSSVAFADTLPDGHMGFPGRLDVRAEFRINAGPALDIRITAVTDAETLCNFAHHSYFNLGGGPTIGDHRLRLAADRYLPVTDTLIPTGDSASVAGTPFDFRQSSDLSDARLAAGIDHNYCMSDRRVEPRPVAWLESADTSLGMTIVTTEPGLQVYDGAAIPTGAVGLCGRVYGPHAGLALEPQVWPDSPNHPGFPSAVLWPGERYDQRTTLVFSRRAV